MKSKKVLIILGPTASGKSDLAVRLARKFKGEIISADSRQVYKGLNIGTGKITKKEMRGIPHHMIDVADPHKYFSVSDYKKLAEKVLQYIVVKKKLPIIVGGTGFYIDTLIGKINLPEVPPNKFLRKKLEKYSTDKLYKILQKKDPRRAKEIDSRNKIRIIRALEIVEALGKVPKLQTPPPSPSPKLGEGLERGQFIWIGINPNKQDLEKRIYKRILKRLDGMIREAKRLRRSDLSIKKMEALGLEYRYLARLLQKKISKKEFIKQLYSAIKDYSKRQMTWFKKNKKIKWFSSASDSTIPKYLAGLIR